MSTKILYLFPDTNLFIQCQPLEQLNWAVWKDFDEVHLLVSRAVQSEIDHQKNRGSDRLGNRARSASGLFREVIVGPDGYKVIRRSNPCVKLFVKPEYRPSAELEERLDYQERDDQLIGTADAFTRQNPGSDARVLTHDTGPMASAKMVGVAYVPIPDDWLLSPESSDSERKILALEDQIKRLKKTEPDFRIAFLNQEGKLAEELEIEPACYDALTDDEVEDLMARIAKAFPPATDFGPREPAKREPQLTDARIHETMKSFRPASAASVTRYRDEQYPGWLERCRKRLRDYHQLLQRRAGQPRFLFVASNEGTRPAKDALITIAARGKFRIEPPPPRGEDDQKGKQDAFELPLPPVPPRGKWVSTLEDLTGMQALMRQVERTSSYPSPGMMEALRLPDFHPRDIQRDPDAFYYKPTRPVSPVSEFSLECQLWRHGVGEEVFEGAIYFNADDDMIDGSLECQIHAENLSSAVELLIPVHIRIRRVRSYDFAKELVDRLIARGCDRAG